jgi:hypothetical protein
LKQANIHPDLVFYFECSDDTAVSRQISRGQRVTDCEAKARERMKLYRNIDSLLVLKQKWFSSLIQVDAEANPDDVWQFVDHVVDHYVNPPKQHSYYPVPIKSNLKTTRFHFHIDAVNHQQLRKIFWLLYNKYPSIQMKIYPIRCLQTGPQLDNYSVYKSMMNFHHIDETSDETFITGRFGDDMDYEQMSIILDTIKESGTSYMTEVEQYVGEWVLTTDSTNTSDNSHKYDDCNYSKTIVIESHYKSKAVDMSTLNCKHPMLETTPPIELHLGFNLPSNQQIDLNKLIHACEQAELNNGGWFIFGTGSYRSNEFSQGTDIELCKHKLVQQAGRLSRILQTQFGYDVDIMFSLEHVHGIWQF